MRDRGGGQGSKQLSGMCQTLGGSVPTQHAGNFLFSFMVGQDADARVCATSFFLFLDQVMLVGHAGDLSEVCDANDLTFLGDAANFFADGDRGCAADSGINFIEDAGGNRLAFCDDLFEGQHNATQFSATGDAMEGFGFFSWVTGQEKLNDIVSCGAREWAVLVMRRQCPFVAGCLIFWIHFFIVGEIKRFCTFPSN